ncbi:hypothetical protein [Agromyces protaetiae]|uniref:hypothetical protein n=1 Tax=Agromyces protaetiae TaxID=2509455 RepID=UPI0026A0889F
MLHAYQTLRDEGFLELRRGRGAIVMHDAPRLDDVRRLAAELAAAARERQLAPDTVLALVREELAR